MSRPASHLHVRSGSIRAAADLVATMLEDSMPPSLLREGLSMIRRTASGNVFSIQRLKDRIEVREANGR